MVTVQVRKLDGSTWKKDHQKEIYIINFWLFVFSQFPPYLATEIPHFGFVGFGLVVCKPMEASANDHKVKVRRRDALFTFHRSTLIPFALMAGNSLNCVSKRSLYSLNSGINIWYSPWSTRLVDITYPTPSFSIAVFRDMSQQQHFFVWLMHLNHKQQYPHTALVDCTLTRGKRKNDCIRLPAQRCAAVSRDFDSFLLIRRWQMSR